MLRKVSLGLAAACLSIVLAPATALASSYTFDGAPDNEIDRYFYAISGGIFPTGTDPNGTRASGGTFARIWDDPAQGAGIDTWTRDGWFEESAGMAVTMYNGATVVYDNNGIDAGTAGTFYSAQDQGTANAETPGLYQMYSNANNYDHIYASYFELTSETAITSMTGFFNWNGLSSEFDATDPNLVYRFNIWSVTGDCQQDNVGCLPVNTGSFQGDVFSSDLYGGLFAVAESGAFREFANGTTDSIGRLTYTLAAPFTLGPGEYYISYDASIATPVPEPATLTLLGLGLLGVATRARNRRRS